MEVIKFAGNSDFANQLELCNVNQNPMFGNASVLFPTLWRFLPILDDQVRQNFETLFFSWFFPSNESSKIVYSWQNLHFKLCHSPSFEISSILITTTTLTILSTRRRPCFLGYTCSRYFPVFCAKQFIYGRSCLWWHQMIHYEALFVNWKLYRRHKRPRKFNIFSEGNRMHYSKMKTLYTYFFARILYGVWYNMIFLLPILRMYMWNI